jgi:hypothetical protein
MSQIKKDKIKKLSSFEIRGGYEITLPPAKRVSRDLKSDFWIGDKAKEEIRNEHGVYVFYRRHGKKYHPLYVGRAYGENGFEQEVFHSDKIVKYNEAIQPEDSTRKISGEYGFLFLVLDRKLNSGKKAKLKKYHMHAIESLEEYLIHQGYVKNKEIQNDKLTESSMPNWIIQGIADRGKKPKSLKSYFATFQTKD